MSTFAVSHAYGADENSVWFPYLTAALEKEGHRVRIPRLPNSHEPRLEPWREAFATALSDTPAVDTVLIGHSIGGVNILRTLERHDAARTGPFAGVVLVATPARSVGYEALAEFFAEPFDWARIRPAAQRFRVLTAVDDPVLSPDPTGHVHELVRELNATAVVTATGGHFGATPDERLEVPEIVRLALDCLRT